MICLDLEDAVAASRKAAARETVARVSAARAGRAELLLPRAARLCRGALPGLVRAEGEV